MFQRVVFHDDDTFFDLDKLNYQLEHLSIAKNPSDLICGAGLWPNTRAKRWGKYQLTENQWSSEFYFPAYCGFLSNNFCELFFQKIRSFDHHRQS